MNEVSQSAIYVVLVAGGVAAAFTDREDADRYAVRADVAGRVVLIFLDMHASPRLDALSLAAALDISLRRAQTLIATHPRGRRLDGKLTLPWTALADLRKRPGPGRRKGAA